MSLVQEGLQNLETINVLFTTGGEFDTRIISKKLPKADLCENCSQRPGESHDRGTMRGNQIAMKRVINWLGRNG